MIQRINNWKWIITTILCFVLLYTLPSSFVEQYYATNLFVKIRKLLDNTFGKLPFSSIYLFLGILLIVFINWFLHFFREKPKPFIVRLLNTFSFFGFLTTLFFILWGFNYGRIPLETKQGLQIKPLNNEQLIAETDTTIANLLLIRKNIKDDTGALPQIVFINKIEDNCRTALNATLQQFYYPYSEKLRTRFILDDMLMLFNVGGQYVPFVGEGGVDDAVFFSKKPFYVIHEMAHGNGFTQEAECSFLAYVSCMNSNNKSFQYSAEFNYLLYLLNELKLRDEQTYTSILEKMPLLLKHDLDAYKIHQEEHTFKTGKIGDVINNLYLKTMGVQDGILNYDKMVLLIYAWKHHASATF